MDDDPQAPLVIDDDLLAAGFITVPRAVWLNTSLTIAARSLYATLLHFAWETERPCWPGYQRLTRLHRWSRGSLSKYLHELQRTGYLSITRRGQGLTNLYTLHAPRTADVQILDIKKASSPKPRRPGVQKLNGEVSPNELPGRQPEHGTPRDASRRPRDHFEGIAHR